jgi:ATP-dependent DNA helicase RecG
MPELENTTTAPPPADDSLIDRILESPEDREFECKRLSRNLNTVLESVVALANTDGGIIALGIEDPSKAEGRDRVYGIQERPECWDELRRLLRSRITEPSLLQCIPIEIGCTLRDGQRGSVVFLKIEKSARVHSIVSDGTFVRLDKGNRQLTAPEINELCFARGTISAESQFEQVPFDLLETSQWREYSQNRGLTRPIDQAMRHIGLAKEDAAGVLRPTRAAVLLFAEDPSGLLAGKAAVRVFHYRGNRIQTDPKTNLVKPPRTVTGPLIRQIKDATDLIVNELASGIQMGPLGFEIVQEYPLRVLREAITNAVIHRDYHVSADVHVRIFSDRIEVHSPGAFVGPVTARNINHIGTHSRNPQIVNHLREFPAPPNLDAGEGVKMMFGTMRAAGLYPPLYLTSPPEMSPAVTVCLLNENRPTTWEQVSAYIDEHGPIGNAEVRRLLETDDTLRASQHLKKWCDLGLLVVANPQLGKRVRKYTKPGVRARDRLLLQPQ